jgi:CheY-specific phosphatase CheX
VLQHALRQALRQSVDEVLDKMFFVCPLGEASPGAEDAAPAMVARLAFQGEPSGSLTLRLTCQAARSIAADFLGEDEESLTGQRIGEVVREMANMICGSVLSRVEGAAAFHLGEPRILTPAEDAAEPDGALALAVDLPNGRLTLLMRTERLECPKLAESAC